MLDTEINISCLCDGPSNSGDVALVVALNCPLKARKPSAREDEASPSAYSTMAFEGVVCAVTQVRSLEVPLFVSSVPSSAGSQLPIPSKKNEAEVRVSSYQ